MALLMPQALRTVEKGCRRSTKMGDGEKEVSPLDTRGSQPEFFSSSLSGMKRQHDVVVGDTKGGGEDGVSIDSTSKKRFRYRSYMGDCSETAQNSPLAKHESIRNAKSDGEDTILESNLSDDGLASGKIDDASPVLDTSDNPSFKRMEPRTGTSSPAIEAAERAQVFGIGFFPDSPVRDSSPPSANNKYQPLSVNDKGTQKLREGGPNKEFEVSVSSEGKSPKTEINDSTQMNLFHGRGGKDLPKLDNSRASLDHPDDDRLVAADTEVPSSTHSPYDFQSSDANVNQVVPLQINRQQYQSQISSYPKQPKFPRTAHSPIPSRAPVPAPMIPFDGMQFAQFPPTLPGAITTMQQQVQGVTYGGCGISFPYNVPPPPMLPVPAEPTVGLETQSSPSKGVPLSLSCDHERISEYQYLIRAQLEIFEATKEDVKCSKQGRKRQVQEGQVGIRCRHCALLPFQRRGRGSVYYPSKLQGKVIDSFEFFLSVAVLCFISCDPCLTSIYIRFQAYIR